MTADPDNDWLPAAAFERLRTLAEVPCSVDRAALASALATLLDESFALRAVDGSVVVGEAGVTDPAPIEVAS